MERKYIYIRSIVSLLMCTGAYGANAQESTNLTFNYGFTVTTNYVYNGATQTDDGPAFQPFFELGYNGFYAGAWASTGIDFGNSDSVEVDLLLGYRHYFESGYYLTAGYGWYHYDDSHFCCESLTLTAGGPLGDTGISGELWYDYATTYETSAYKASVSYQLQNDVSLAASYGHEELLDNDFWTVGGSYSVNDNYTLDLTYYGTEAGNAGLSDPGFVLSLTGYF